MIRSDETLKRMIADGDLVVEPLDEVQIQPTSIDMTLGTHFLKVDEHSHTVLTLDQPTAL
jgi:dCTP deaminase